MAKNWSFNRRRGYAKRIDKTVRSNFESRVKAHLEKQGVNFTYETLRIPYTTSHHYKPDFVLANGVIVEAKGLFLPEDRTKHLRIRELHPHLDIRFLFQKDQPIFKGSKTKYSDWCKKHGYKYAIGTTIPATWTKEKDTNVST